MTAITKIAWVVPWTIVVFLLIGAVLFGPTPNTRQINELQKNHRERILRIEILEKKLAEREQQIEKNRLSLERLMNRMGP